MTDDLAGGFQKVDDASDFALFSNCLTLIDSLPFFAECNRESYDLLGAKLGKRILEVGCGLGDDALSLARLVAPGGSVIGIDGSQAMITAARGATVTSSASPRTPGSWCPGLAHEAAGQMSAFDA
jgi:ubiquinone/menaquinone biosynthesis C-methylase UbiE